MAAFEDSKAAKWREICISRGVHGAPPRGGSSITSTSLGMFIFGGADRNQQAMNDAIVCNTIVAGEPRIRQSSWKTQEFSETEGDIPQPRSGHACVAYGKHLFLFGGIDFAEESTFNDLYVLNMDTLVWRYVGEAGAEIEARNSHSLGIIRTKDQGEAGNVDYIVVFGGASVEKGPLGDTFYAKLPKDEADLDQDTFFVTWKELKGTKLPKQREMHGTSSRTTSDNEYASMIITGGRFMETVLDDAWELVPASTTVADSTTTTTPAAESTEPLEWRHRPDLMLDIPRCSHGSCVIPSGQGYLLCLTGGFSGDGLSNELSYLAFSEAVNGESTAAAPVAAPSSSSSSSSSSSKALWQSTKLASLEGGRFGVASCVAPDWLAHTVLDKAEESYTGSSPLCLFGGINQQKDFKDVILLVPPKVSE